MSLYELIKEIAGVKPKSKALYAMYEALQEMQEQIEALDDQIKSMEDEETKELVKEDVTLQAFNQLLIIELVEMRDIKKVKHNNCRQLAELLEDTNISELLRYLEEFRKLEDKIEKGQIKDLKDISDLKS